MSPERLSIAEAQARLQAVRADARAETPAEPTHGPAAQPDAQPAPKARSAQKRRTGERRAVADRFAQFRAATIGTPALTAAPRCLLVALIEHTNATTGRTWVSRATLADELGINKEAVSASMRVLKAGGYVVIDEPASPGASRAAVKRVTDPSSWPKSRPELRRRLDADAKRKAEQAAASADGTNPPADAGAGGRQPLHGGPAHER